MFSIKELNNQKYVEIDNTEISKKLEKLSNRNQIRKEIREFLKNNFKGKQIPISFIDKYNENLTLNVLFTVSDKKISYTGYKDIALSLFQAEELLKDSKYSGESVSIAKENKTPETDKFNYYYYFDILVKYKNNFYGYELSIGINKENNIPTIYAITNKTKEEASPQVSNPHRTSSTYSITQNEDKATKYSLKEFDYENKDYII